jgi:hypothetical protein
MIAASELYARAIDQVYGAAVRRGQARAMREGLDPTNVVPDEYDPNFVTNTLASDRPGGGGPPAGAVAYLKEHPETREQFDRKYGQGAAQKVFGQ